jgi:hypothetical protein
MRRAADAVGVRYAEVPSAGMVRRIVEKSGTAGWRFHGLKRRECLQALRRVLATS